MADRVGHQIPDHLPRRRRLLRLHHEMDLSIGRRAQMSIRNLSQNFFQVEYLRVPAARSARSFRMCCSTSVWLCGGWIGQAVLRSLQPAADVRQRIAELMGHIGDHRPALCFVALTGGLVEDSCWITNFVIGRDGCGDAVRGRLAEREGGPSVGIAFCRSRIGDEGQGRRRGVRLQLGLTGLIETPEDAVDGRWLEGRVRGEERRGGGASVHRQRVRLQTGSRFHIVSGARFRFSDRVRGQS